MLEIKDLKVNFNTCSGQVQAVRGVDLRLDRGEAIALVGESGCGKSVTAQSVMRILPPQGMIASGRILLNGIDLVNLPEKEMERIRGQQIGMIFQDPMTSLNPTMNIGRQIGEALEKHRRLNRSGVKPRCIEILRMVGLPDPEQRIGQYPHEFSGGMRQRVMIAIAIACNPQVIIADEPTTALDVTIQAQIIDLMRDLQKKTKTSIVLITHDLGLVAGLCDRVLVMYAGQVVEMGEVEEIYYRPAHPYTIGLLSSVPRLDMERGKIAQIAGRPPDMLDPPRGCAFWPRCEEAMRICSVEPPPEFEAGERHVARCWLVYKRNGAVAL